MVKPACAWCGKDAIGIQSFGCRSACVCEDHAYSLLLALRPGEIYSTGEYRFERFATADLFLADDRCYSPTTSGER